MPTYEYECRACGYMFERVQSMSDEPVRECPECDEVRRLIFEARGSQGVGFLRQRFEGQEPGRPEGPSPAPESAEPKAAEAKSGPTVSPLQAYVPRTRSPPKPRERLRAVSRPASSANTADGVGATSACPVCGRFRRSVARAAAIGRPAARGRRPVCGTA